MTGYLLTALLVLYYPDAHQAPIIVPNVGYSECGHIGEEIMSAVPGMVYKCILYHKFYPSQRDMAWPPGWRK